MVTQTLSPGRARSRRQISLFPTDVHRVRCAIVNAYLVGEPGEGNPWVLIDAGMPFCAAHIMSEAAERFGARNPPRKIILTHGHFDHIGSLHTLLRAWPDVPVYAHELELPYLTGQCAYPPPDPTVGGGAMARLSPLFPKRPIDISGRVEALANYGVVPHLSGWRWIHTPGHTPGHVSLFRDADHTLIAGDAFVTQKQESFWGAMTEHLTIHGPPMYFTPDWDNARESVHRLYDLRPTYAFTGHGVPLANPRLGHVLGELARHFDEIALPPHGRYVDQPAMTDGRGCVVSIPPPVADPLPKFVAGFAVVAFAALVVGAARRRSND